MDSAIGAKHMTTDEKTRENKARRRLYRRGYRLIKSRSRDPQGGGYMIVDSRTQGAVAGMDPPFMYSLEDVEAFLRDN